MAIAVRSGRPPAAVRQVPAVPSAVSNGPARNHRAVIGTSDGVGRSGAYSWSASGSVSGTATWSASDPANGNAIGTVALPRGWLRRDFSTSVSTSARPPSLRDLPSASANVSACCGGGCATGIVISIGYGCADGWIWMCGTANVISTGIVSWSGSETDGFGFFDGCGCGYGYGCFVSVNDGFDCDCGDDAASGTATATLTVIWSASTIDLRRNHRALLHHGNNHILHGLDNRYRDHATHHRPVRHGDTVAPWLQYDTHPDRPWSCSTGRKMDRTCTDSSCRAIPLPDTCWPADSPPSGPSDDRTQPPDRTASIGPDTVPAPVVVLPRVCPSRRPTAVPPRRSRRTKRIRNHPTFWTSSFATCVSFLSWCAAYRSECHRRN